MKTNLPKEEMMSQVLKKAYLGFPTKESVRNPQTELSKAQWKFCYGCITRYGVDSGDINKDVAARYFDDFLGYYNNRETLAFSDKHFVHFEHGYSASGDENFIKMYVPLDYSHVGEGSKIIFDYLEDENIPHISKVADRVRTDGVVIRLNNIEAAKKLQNMIDNNAYLQDGLADAHPFSINYHGVGYAYDDGHISYSDMIASIVQGYILEMKEQNVDVKKVSSDSFRNYVERTYFNGRDKSYYQQSPVFQAVRLCVNSNSIDEYYEFIEEEYRVHGVPHIEKRPEFHVCEEDKRSLLDEFILTTMKKFPPGCNERNPQESGYDYVDGYLNGSQGCVTRKRNLRDRVSKNLQPSDIYQIVEDSHMPGNDIHAQVENYIKMTMLNDMIKSSDIRFPGCGIDIVNDYISTGDKNCITSAVGKARELTKSLKPSDVKQLFSDFGVSDINQYAEKYYQSTNKSTYGKS